MIFSKKINFIQECVEEKHKIIDVPILTLIVEGENSVAIPFKTGSLFKYDDDSNIVKSLLASQSPSKPGHYSNYRFISRHVNL